MRSCIGNLSVAAITIDTVGFIYPFDKFWVKRSINAYVNPMARGLLVARIT
jgi:hypothetical protein